MSRLNAVSQALYYPTPLRVVAGLAKLVRLPAQDEADHAGKHLRIIDPCAGKGLAVSFLTGLVACQSDETAGQDPQTEASWHLVGPAQVQPQQRNRKSSLSTRPISSTTNFIETYGIELDSYRAQAAASRMSQVLNTDAKTARVSTNSFELAFHNPPYDSAPGSERRLEHQFLKRVSWLIKPGGLLIHIIPQSSLKVSAEFLANHYEQVEVLRFPWPEYSRFQQVVVLGLKKRTVCEDKALEKQLKHLAEVEGHELRPVPACPTNREELLALLEQTGIIRGKGDDHPEAQHETEETEILEELAQLEQAQFRQQLEVEEEAEREPALAYQIQPQKAGVAAKLIFAVGEYHLAEALEEASRSGVWSARIAREQLTGSSSTTSSKTVHRPLMPLRDGQAALLTSLGLLNNLVLTTDPTTDGQGQAIVVKGCAFKEFKTRKIETDEKGEETSRTDRQILRTELRTLDLTSGELTLIQPAQMSQFIERYKPSIQRQMLENYPPRYIPRRHQADQMIQQLEEGVARLARKPLGGQRLALVGAALSLREQRGTVISAEQGSGKSFLGAGAAYLAGMRRVVVICPTHLTKKWVREITQTIPGAKGVVVKKISDLLQACALIAQHEQVLAKRLANQHEGPGGVETSLRYGTKALPPFFVVISKESMKLDSRWESAVVWRVPMPVPRDGKGRLILTRQAHCPRCGQLITASYDDERPIDWLTLQTKKRYCRAMVRNGKGLLKECREPLWHKTARRVGTSPFLSKAERTGETENHRDANKAGPRRFRLARYIKEKLNGYFDLLVLDECFPGSTRISTPTGLKRIDQIVPGELVLSYDLTSSRIVTRRVTRVIAKKLKGELVRVIHEKGSFSCTPNHKIYTQAGYKPASFLLENEVLLLHNSQSQSKTETAGLASEDQPHHQLKAKEVNQNANYREGVSSLWCPVHLLAKTPPRTADLQQSLWHYSQAAAQEVKGTCPKESSGDLYFQLRILPPIFYARHTRPTPLLQYRLRHSSALAQSSDQSSYRSQSDPQNRGSERGHPPPPPAHQFRPNNPSQTSRGSSRPLLLKRTGWQWLSDPSAAAPSRTFRLAYGISREDGQPLLESRQSRSGKSRTEDSNRVRWRFSSYPQTEKPGQAQGPDAGGAGLGGITLLEFPDRLQTARSVGEDRRGGQSKVIRVEVLETAEQENEYVYDLEVEDTHCYFADGVLVSNCHDMRAKGSAQGIAAGVLASACKKVLALSGTFTGGYSTSLFHLLYRFTDEIRHDYQPGDDLVWAWDYGIIERTTFRSSSTSGGSKEGQPGDEDEEEILEDGAMSDRKTVRVRFKEAPGISPAVLLKLIGYTIFLKITDVARDLPPYQEHVVELPMQGESEEEAQAAGYSQHESYQKLADDLYAEVRRQLIRGSSRLLGALVQSLLSWPDNPTLEETVIDKRDGKVVASAPALPPEILYPKEQALLDLYRREKANGRKLLVFISNTKKRDLAPRLKAVLEREAGAKVAVLRSDKVEASEREEWVERQLQQGIDVLVCHPRLVQTGLDLLSFQTILFYQIEYSVYVQRQASRRSWRIGQTEPIHVYHFVYKASSQAGALRHQARKMQASNLLEGDLSAEGLVGLADEENEDNLMLEMARAIVREKEKAQASTTGLSGLSQAETEEDATTGLSLEDLLASLHQSEIGAAKLILEAGLNEELELEEAIAELYEALVSPTQIETATHGGANQANILPFRAATPEGRVESSGQQPKVSLEQLRELMLKERAKKHTHRSRAATSPSEKSPNGAVQQLSLF